MTFITFQETDASLESNTYRSSPPTGLRLVKLKGHLRKTLREMISVLGEDEAREVVREFFSFD